MMDPEKYDAYDGDMRGRRKTANMRNIFWIATARLYHSASVCAYDQATLAPFESYRGLDSKVLRLTTKSTASNL
jgi:hypothetical protein